MAEDPRSVARARAYDAVVVGAGPNGLAAAIALAKEGLSVIVLEARPNIGGGARSAALTREGFVHDVCSAIHPMAIVSPFFRTLPLAEHGLSWAFPEAAVAHPLDDGTAALLVKDFDAMHETLGRTDARNWRELLHPLVEQSDALYHELLGPLRFPKSPLLLTQFGLSAMRSAVGLAESTFVGGHARALFAGCAAHSFLPLEQAFSAAFGLVLSVSGHVVGWPAARGGSMKIVDALASVLRSYGGEIVVDCAVRSFDQLPEARAVLFDTTPSAMARICGERLPASFRSALCRFRHGPGVFKIDYALDGPIPWKAPECARAATVHLGGTLPEIAASERAAWSDTPADKPFVLVAQQSLFDDTRAPAGMHTGWAYCHVPRGCTVDMTARIEAQIERFAPGFRHRVVARHVMSPADFERYNENNIGGDIAGGANDLAQLFTRPVARAVPCSTPNESIFLCSSSTPPGGGVHGMCGWFAAQQALRRVFGKRVELPPAAPAT